jgi:hypothetical protein
MRARSGSVTLTVEAATSAGAEANTDVLVSTAYPTPATTTASAPNKHQRWRRDVRLVAKQHREQRARQKAHNGASTLVTSVRTWLLQRVEAETVTVLRFQRWFAFNAYSRLYFTVFTTLFDEVCYTAVFPCIAWAMSPLAAVHIGFFVALSFYAGSSLKVCSVHSISLLFFSPIHMLAARVRLRSLALARTLYLSHIRFSTLRP